MEINKRRMFSKSRDKKCVENLCGNPFGHRPLGRPRIECSDISGRIGFEDMRWKKLLQDRLQ
jgi:hypothetical protein